MAAKKKRAKSSKGKFPPARVPEKQWRLPASFSIDGIKLANLKELLDPAVQTLSLALLTPEQRAHLVEARIASQPSFAVTLIGAGEINQQRALAEIRGQTPVGKALIEIEHNLIQSVLRAAEQPK
jgi:hypothetical protein